MNAEPTLSLPKAASPPSESGADAAGCTAALLFLLGVAVHTLSPMRSTRHIDARRDFHASHWLFGLEVASIWSRQIRNSRRPCEPGAGSRQGQHRSAFLRVAGTTAWVVKPCQSAQLLAAVEKFVVA